MSSLTEHARSWVFIPDSSLTHSRINQAKALTGAAYSFQFVNGNAGYCMPREDAGRYFDFDTMDTRETIQYLDAPNNMTEIRANRFILSSFAVGVWEAELETFIRNNNPGEEYITREREAIAYQVSLRDVVAATPIPTAAIVEPVEENNDDEDEDDEDDNENEDDDFEYDDPVVNPNDTPIYGHIQPAEGPNLSGPIIQHPDREPVNFAPLKEILTLEQAEETFASFMKPDEALALSFYHPQLNITFAVSGTLLNKVDYPDVDNLFVLLIPEPNENARCTASHVVGTKRFRCFSAAGYQTGTPETPVQHICMTNNIRVPECEFGTVYPFKTNAGVKGVTLGLGYQLEWTKEDSTLFFSQILPQIIKAFYEIFPEWTGDTTGVLSHFYDKNRERRLVKLQQELDAARANAISYADRAKREEQTAKTLEGTLEEARGVAGKETWIKNQADIMNMLPIISCIQADNHTNKLSVWVGPVIISSPKFDYYIGRFRIDIGGQRSSFGSVAEFPIEVINLDYGQHTYQHPHCHSEGNYCWGNTTDILRKVWSVSDVVGTLQVLIEFLSHVNIGDQYAAHLKYFKRRQAGTSGTWEVPPRDGWREINNELDAMRAAQRGA